ncbi:hypothetical protein D0469_15685 [Peribacillus saganii]|uniref:Uncharacterized protein n=1 Tax=Peribacillus saganii TaxID=2303992 RepID=A0A372LL60_9BACI|nr:hypothetical protein [Peribacillus saganii]RFU67330.1 hypothetical protein D0469_15685 [Peribacillus saganii]
MSASRYYSMCSRGVGKAVEIRTHDGRTHRGIIDRVSSNRVYLRPFGRSYGGYGYGWGWGWGFGAGIALGAIAALAFIPFFW